MNRRFFCLAPIACGIGSLSAAQSSSHYVGILNLQALPQGRQMKLLNTFSYEDAAGISWSVPAQAVVDGASIPPVLWSIVGGPWEGMYRDASVVHDWFCAVRTMPHVQTHRMFHEAMLTSGVDSNLARILYLAVRFAGPSWDDLTIQNSRLISQNGTRRLYPPRDVFDSGFTSEDEGNEARSRVLMTFDALLNEVDANDLSLDEVDALVDREGRMETLAARIAPLMEPGQ